MPTGYTSDVANGKITTLREFAMRCARGMGATILMRDEPFDAPIPERFAPSTSYYDEAIAKAEAELARIPALTDAQCENEAEAAYNEARSRRAEFAAESAEQRKRYDAMLAAAEAWDCRAEGLKEFMLEQLRSSIDHDCGDLKWYPEPERQTGAEWRQKTLEAAAASLGRSATERAKEITRTEERNRWLANLRASLPAKAEGQVVGVAG